MRTFSLMKGLPVYEQSGEKLGEICDICIGEEGLVTDILLQVKGIIGKKFRIPIQSVTAFGEDSIMLESGRSLMKYSELDDEYTMMHGRPLMKKNILCSMGTQLGLLDDVYFHEEVGTIVGYELTEGFFSDISEGKKVVRTVEPPSIGKDAIILSGIKNRGGKTNDEVPELPEQGSW